MKHAKKLLSVLLAVTMVVTSLTVVPLFSDVTAEAETWTEVSDTTSTTNFKTEFSNASTTGDTTYIRLSGDCNLGSANGATAVSGAKIVLDLNGHRIRISNKSAGTAITVNQGATLTIMDSANSTNSIVWQNNADSAPIANAGTLNIEGGWFARYNGTVSTVSTKTISEIGTLDTSNPAIFNTGTLNIKGGYFVNQKNPSASSITGGYFKTSVTPDTNYGCITNTDSTTSTLCGYKVVQYVAQVGTTRYETLAEAWTTAIAETEATVKMLADTTLTTALSNIPSTCDLTLDLNGKKITTSGNIYFVKDSTGDLIITDTSSDDPATQGTIAYAGAFGTTGYGFIGVKYVSGDGSGTITLNGGNIVDESTNGYPYGLLGAYNGSATKITVNGGTVQAQSGKNAICVANGTGYINGGKVLGSLGIKSAGTGTYVVTGGTFDNNPTSYVDTEEYTVQVDTPTSGLYTVGKGVATVTVGEATTAYSTLAEAITAAVGTTASPVTESTIKLLQDINLSARMNLRIGTGTTDATTHTITFDANGKTITTTAKNGFEIINSGTTLNITGNGNWVVNNADASAYYFYGNSGATINVLSGTFTDGKALNNGSGTLNIKGGTWNVDPTDKVPSGYQVNKSSGSWTVSKLDAQVTIDGVTTNYSSIDDAVSAFIAGTGSSQTLKLFDNVTTSTRFQFTAGEISAEKEYTIDLNGFNLTETNNNPILVRAYDTVNIVDTSDSKNATFNLAGTNTAFFFCNKDVTAINFDLGTSKFTGTNVTTWKSNTNNYPITVTTGKFSLDPTEYATGPVSGPAEGLYTVTKGAASVKIGSETTYYGTLTEAFTYIDTKDSATATITLLDDIDLSSRIVLTEKASDTANTITLDLNNHTINYTGSNSGAIWVKNYNNLTITDNSTACGGTITSSENATNYIVSSSQYGYVVVEGGTYNANYFSYYQSSSGTNVKVTLDGGKFNFDPRYSKNTAGTDCTNTVNGYNAPVEGVYSVGACRIGSSTMTYSLPCAVKRANNNDTITICADIDLTSALLINSAGGVSSSVKNLTITDDGTARTISLKFTTTEDAGIVIGAGKNITFKGTQAGYLKISGVDNSGDTPAYCNKSAFATAVTKTITNTTLNLTNVTITNCSTTSSGAAVYNKGTTVITNSTITDNATTANGAIYNANGATLEISGSTISNNTAKLAGGIYNYGSGVVTLGANTTITNNKSEGNGGGVYLNKNSDGETGKIYLNGTYITVSGNSSNTKTEQEGEKVDVPGKTANITVKYDNLIVISGDISGGSIGVNYAENERAGAYLPIVKESYSPTQNDVSSINCDGDSSLKAYVISDSTYVARWKNYQYSILTSGITRVQDETYAYKVANASVTQDPYANAKIISIAVDSGYFTIPWNQLGISDITKVWAVDNEGRLTDITTVPTDETQKYKAITLVSSSDIADQQITDFIKLPIYNVVTNAVCQEIYVGLQPAEKTGAYYFAGSFYSYNSISERWSQADNAAVAAGAHLANITSSVENSIVHAIVGSNNAWLGAIRAYDAWYWQRGYDEGLQITGNITTSEGYQGVYTNFANSTPFIEATFGRLYMTTAGKWKEADGETATGEGGKSIGSVLEYDDASAKNPVAETNLTRSDKDVLTAISAGYENSLEMSYYFTFSDETRQSASAKVSIKVGDADATEFNVSTIVAGEATSDGDYKITIPVAPKTMADKVTVKIIDGDVEREFGSGTGYNLQYYALRAIELNEQGEGDYYTRTYSNDFAEMAKAMLHYGAAAQTQFSHNTDNLADSTIAAPGAVPASISEDKCIFSKTGSAITSAALVSDSMTGLRIYFTGSESTVTVNGKSYSTEVDGSERYVEFPMSAKELSKIYTVVINENNSCQINAYYVINAIMKSGDTTADAKATAYRLYEFGEAAAIYYGAYKPSRDMQFSVLNTAYAYLQKGQYVDYDQKQISADSYNISGVVYKNPRRQMVVTPEEATSTKTVYMDCSSFVYDVYELVFGAEATQLAFGESAYSDQYSVATKNLIEDNTGVYSKGQASKSMTLDDQTGGLPAIYAELREELQPGDLLIKYRYQDEKSAHGHVVLWTGDGFIHCTGSSYDFTNNTDKVDADGAIYYVPETDLETEFGLSGFHYVKILRPLEYMTENNISITEGGTARQQMGETGYELYGTSPDGRVLCDGQGVKQGDVITFTINIDNKRKGGTFNLDTWNNISLTLPEELTYVSGSASDSGVLGSNNTLSWSEILTAKDSERQLTFRATVTGYTTDDLGNNIIDFADEAGKVTLCEAGYSSETITFTSTNICVEGVDANAETIINNAIALRDGTQTTTETGLAVIKSLFGKTAFNTAYSTDGDLFRGNGNEIYSGSSADWTGLVSSFSYGSNFLRGCMYTLDRMLTNVCFDYMVSNFLGGYQVTNSAWVADFFGKENRVRNITERNLMVGDVIACCKFNDTTYQLAAATYSYFVYLGEDQGMLAVTYDGTTNTIGSADAGKILDSLLGAYDIFAVLRFIGR